MSDGAALFLILVGYAVFLFVPLFLILALS